MAPREYDGDQEPYQNFRKQIEFSEVYDGSHLWSPLLASEACGGGFEQQTPVKLQRTPSELASPSFQYSLTIDSATSTSMEYCLDDQLPVWASDPGLSSRNSSATLQTDGSDIEFDEWFQSILPLEGQEPVAPFKSKSHVLDESMVGPIREARTDQVNQRHGPIVITSMHSGRRSSSISPSAARTSDTDSLPELAPATKQTQCFCGASFQTIADLERHARENSHKPFVCSALDCTASFARRDALLRHRATHAPQQGPSYPCVMCERYRGSEAFKRKDHLVQHMRKVHPRSVDRVLSHKFCSYANCHFSGVEGRFGGFGTRKEHARHMRSVHGQGTRDCDFPGCDRVGAQGFARDRDLRLHCEKMHSSRETNSSIEMMSE